MSTFADGTKQNTKKLRFTLLSAFFNYVKNTIDPEIKNPCDNPALRKLFRAGKHAQIEILEKDVVDEIIFRTRNSRNRLMLEIMARSGMRVGEVLKLRPIDIEDRKAIIRDPKSGKDIWEKSVTPGPCGGSIICMGDSETQRCKSALDLFYRFLYLSAHVVDVFPTRFVTC